MQNNKDMSSTVQIVRRWGGLAADALLDPSTLFFKTSGFEGAIGYRNLSGCAVVFGDPICPPEELFSLVDAFEQFCQQQKMPIIYMMASKPFADWAQNHQKCKAAIQFGEELNINPQNDPRDNHGTQASLVRRKVRRAIKEGVMIKEHQTGDEATEKRLEQVADSWVKERQGPQIHISHVRLFENRVGKRWFYAVQNEKMVGMIVINLLEAHHGWLMNHLMITPDAPQGTQEMLVVSILETLKNEGFTFVTFGVAPGTKIGEIWGLNSFTAMMSRSLYRLFYRFFHLQGLRMFWGKFHPDSSPSYLLFSQSSIGFKEIKALMNAMNVC